MQPSRRQVLVTAGTTLFGGCASLRRFTRPDRRGQPVPFLTEPGDWAHPEYDPANTNAPPGSAAPDTIAESPAWTAEFTASELEVATRPVVADGIAYLALAGVDRGEEFERLVATDIRTGEERWRFEVHGSAFAYPPIVAGETVFWLAAADTVYALHPVDRRVRWRHVGANHTVPLVAHGLVLTVGGTPAEPVLQALDPHTGTPYWTRSEGGRDWTLVAADDEAFYVTLRTDTDEQSSELHALAPMTGETRWMTPRVAPRTAGLNSSSLFTVTGRSESQELVALDTAVLNRGTARCS